MPPTVVHEEARSAEAHRLTKKTAYVPPEDAARLDRLAAAERLTTSSYLRRMIAREVEAVRS